MIAIPQIPIFCLNLARAADRRTRITETWTQEYGFDVQFWQAFDRRLITNEWIKTNVKTHKRFNLPGQIANVLSRIEFFQWASKQQLRDGIILLEDDCYPLPRAKYLFETINQARRTFDDVRFIYFAKASNKKRVIERTRTHKDGFRLLRQGIVQTPGVWYSQFVFDILIRKFKELNEANDLCVKHIARTHNAVYIDDPLAVHIQSHTYIGNNSTRPHRIFIE